MKKYLASPDAVVIGVAMRNFFVSINHDEFEALVREELNKAGIAEIDDDTWYPHQITLDIFKRINEQTQESNLVALGMAYVETALFPPEINSIHTGLNLLANTYHMNIHNAPAKEGYEARVLSDNHIQIIDNNPFPHDTVYGFIWGICKRFASPYEQYSVYRTFESEADPDSAGAIYDIKIAPKR